MKSVLLGLRKEAILQSYQSRTFQDVSLLKCFLGTSPSPPPTNKYYCGEKELYNLRLVASPGAQKGSKEF